MKKILLILTISSTALLYGQDGPPIPVFDEPNEPPAATEVAPPTVTAPTTPAAPAAPVASTSAAPTTPVPTEPQAGGQPADGQQFVTVQPGVAREIHGAPVLDPAKDFMGNFVFEALFSSRQWLYHWGSPDMGLMRVSSLPQPMNTPHGSVLTWQRDVMSNPMVYLRARVNFPKIRQPDAVSGEQPLGTTQVVISQAVIFYQRPDGWMASSSPLYVTLNDEGREMVLVPLSRGQAVWRAMVGHGGIYVENFVGAGLAAARTEINQYFRDEEIRLFTMGNSDVIFYLRPQGGLVEKGF